MVDMDGKYPIVLCEPQCFGFEHAPVNAALLGVFQHAFPERELVFISEATHGQCVFDLCKRAGVTYRSVTVLPPRRNLGHIKRIFPERRHFSQVVTFVESLGCQAIVFTSLTDTGYYLQKKSVEKGNNIRFINFLHGMLQSLREPAPRKPWKKPFWFPGLLRQPIHENILFIVYGESIRSLAVQLLPTLTDHILTLDHPVFFHSPGPPERNTTVHIGSVGIGGRSKGTHLLFDLARKFVDETRSGLVEFTVIGPLVDKKIKEIPECVHVPSPDAPLERLAYERHIGSIDYALYLYDATAYTLTASGAFMDAVAFAKPIIALENPFFRAYFDRFGDIGFLCPTIEEVFRTIKMLADDNQQQRYRAQVQNIKEGRESISLPALGTTLNNMFADLL